MKITVGELWCEGCWKLERGEDGTVGRRPQHGLHDVAGGRDGGEGKKEVLPRCQPLVGKKSRSFFPLFFSEAQRDGGSCCDSVPQFRSAQTGVESGVDEVGVRVGTWQSAGVS